MLHTLRQHFTCADCEVTLEADPETIDASKAAAWLAAGINRISLGTQSFIDRELTAAGRMHRREDIFRAANLLRAAGFANLSFDLIAGLPHQTAESWQESLDQLLSLRPEHVSVYLLEIDEGSRLGRESLAGGARYGAAAIPEDDAMAAFYERGVRPVGCRWLRTLRNLQLGAARQSFAPQPEILAPRTLSRLWRRGAFVRRTLALG